jgi:hypothetical protein
MRIYLSGLNIITETDGGSFIASYPQGSVFMIPLFNNVSVMIGIRLLLNTSAVILNIENYDNLDANNRISNQAGVPFTTAKDAYDYLIPVLGFDLGVAWGAITGNIINQTDLISLINFSNLSRPIRSVMASTNVLLSDYTILANAISNSITLSLPSAASAFDIGSGRGLAFELKKIDNSANEVIIDGLGSETIDGQLTINLAQIYESVTIQSNGINWHILASF